MAKSKASPKDPASSAQSVTGTPSATDTVDLDATLVAACEHLALDPTTIMAWNVRGDNVVVIDADGRKHSVEA